MNIKKQDIRHILLISLTNLGDIILTTPVLEALNGAFPRASIDVVCGPSGKDIFKTHPRVDDVIVTAEHRSLRGRLALVRELRKRHYDMVVDLKNTLMPYVLGARYRLPGLMTGRRKRVLHKKEEHLRKLSRLGLEPVKAGFFVGVSDEEKARADELLASCGNMVLICPGAKSNIKRWGHRNFAGLCDRLAGELKCGIVLAGNGEDRAVVDMVKSLTSAPVVDICEKTTVGTLAGVMEKAAVVITNDSAPLHLASAVGVPTVAIFGPSDERKYGPLSKKSKVLKPAKPCRPCGKSLCRDKKDIGCIGDISVDEVFGAVRDIMSSE